MRFRSIIFLVTFSVFSAHGLLAAAEDQYPTLAERLAAGEIEQLPAADRLEIASDLIRCQWRPLSREEYLKLFRHYQEIGHQVSAEQKQAYHRCIGLTPEGFYHVESLLGELADEGNLTAQLAYFRYVMPSSANRFSYHSPEVSPEEIASNSERFLLMAARSGKHMALLHLSDLTHNGPESVRDQVMSAAYLAAYEACTGEVAAPYMGMHHVYSDSKGLEPNIAYHVEKVVREMGCEN